MPIAEPSIRQLVISTEMICTIFLATHSLTRHPPSRLYLEGADQQADTLKIPIDTRLDIQWWMLTRRGCVLWPFLICSFVWAFHALWHWQWVALITLNIMQPLPPQETGEMTSSSTFMPFQYGFKKMCGWCDCWFGFKMYSMTYPAFICFQWWIFWLPTRRWGGEIPLQEKITYCLFQYLNEFSSQN